MERTAGKRRWQQIFYVLAPFFLLLACLAFINFIPRQSAAGSTAVAQSEGELSVSRTAVPPTTSLSQPTATLPPTPTLIPTATLPPDAAIDLLGPPDGSRFRQFDTISFYADWSLALVEPQQLAAYIRFDDEPPILLGTLDEPNIGRRYRWQLDISEMVVTAVSLEWWIQLQNAAAATPLLTSPTRQIVLLP